MKFLIGLLLFWSCICFADYPGKPIRIIVGYVPGGGNDIVARIVASRLSIKFNEKVIVENKPGAESLIAANYVVNSSPDGYTVLMGPSGLMTLNTITGLKPISMLCSFPLVLVVNDKTGIRSFEELLVYGKGQSNLLNYASGAKIFEVITEQFKRATNTEFEMIPYKGNGETIKALLQQDVIMAFLDPAAYSTYHRSGLLRALAITSKKRYDRFNDVPTMIELGYPQLEYYGWMGLFVPSDTPDYVVNKLEKEITDIIADEEVIERLTTLGLDPVGSSAEYLLNQINKDKQKLLKQ